MIRNLLAAEPQIDAAFEALTDSANPESNRGSLPPAATIVTYRARVAERVRARVEAVEEGSVGAPGQLRVVAHQLLVSLVDHEYQHDAWIAEVRRDELAKELPSRPVSAWLVELDGYTVLAT